MAKLNKKYILTIGVGKKLYVDLALNLARSFFLWHPGSEIAFQLVTDQPQNIPAHLKSKIEVKTIMPGEYGVGFSPKLYLDKFVNDGQTLFIDSDCLIFENLERLFALFEGHNISVVGSYIADGEWFGDIGALCKRLGVPHIPKFNGGLYYLEKGQEADRVYETARNLEKKYDELGFQRLRGRPNDEVLMAVAMQINSETPVTDDGTIMSDPQACPGGYFVDVIKGRRRLINPPPSDPLHCDWYPFHEVSPAIVHFLGHYIQNYPYKREVYRLQNFEAGRLNLFHDIKAKFTIQYPAQVKTVFKKVFRPFYKALFGNRMIKPSERIA